MPVGTSDGETFKDSGEWLAHTTLGVPLERPTEPADAFKSQPGTPLPGNTEKAEKGFLDRLSIVNPLSAMMKGPNIEEDVNLVKGIYESAKKAFSLPGDVYGGKIDPASPQGIERAFDLASFMVLGPAPVAAKMADGTLGSFAGVKSQTLKKEKLSALGEAQVLEANAAHPDEIHKATGFFRGADNRWRYEIDDSKMVFNKDWHVDTTPPKPSWSKVQKELVTKPLSEVIDHPELFKAYPDLKEVKVIHDPNITGASFSSGSNSIAIGTDHVKNSGTLMHEVQHAIQGIEGFAKGGSPGVAGETYTLKLAKDAKEKILDPLSKLASMEERWGLTEAAQQEKARLLALAEKFQNYAHAGNVEAFNNYQKLAGEVEARNVDTRLLMSEADRRKVSPRWTEDTGRSQQYVLDQATYTDPYMAQRGLNKGNIDKISK